MGHRFHRGFTAAEKTELWDRWEARRVAKAIDELLQAVIVDLFFGGSACGIRPAGGVRSRLALTLAETRGDFQRRYGTSIGTIDRQVAWPLTLDGEAGK